MVCLFIKTLPVQVRFQENESIVACLASLQKQQMKMMEYEYTPLVDIARWCGAMRADALFESVFVFENYPMERAVENSSGAMRVMPVQSQDTSNYPIVLIVAPGKELMLEINYATDRFSAEGAMFALRDLKRILKTVVHEPQLTAAGIQQILEQEDQRRLRQEGESLHEMAGKKLQGIERRRIGVGSPTAKN